MKVLCKAVGVVAGLLVEVVVSAAIPGSSLLELLVSSIAALISGYLSYRKACSVSGYRTVSYA